MIGRPQAGEAALYYFTYINCVIGEDAAAVIDLQLEESLAFFSVVSEEKSLYRYAPEKWSMRQALNHVTDTERVFAFRALWFARGFDGPLPDYDQNIAASGAQADRVSWAAHVDEFRRVRLATVALFANMPPEAWKEGASPAEMFLPYGLWHTSAPATSPTISQFSARDICRETRRAALQHRRRSS